MPTVSDGARVALGLVRLFNGTAALLASDRLGSRVGIDAEASPQSAYFTRLFGVRTVLLGYELLQPDPVMRRQALRVAPYVHAADTAAAVLTAASGRVPRRAGVATVLISSVNTALALAARRSS